MKRSEAAMLGWLRRVTEHPKSTANGVLGFGIVLLLALQFDVAGHLVMTSRDWVLMTLAAARFAVLALSTDAGTVMAKTRDGEVKAVPAHEVPDEDGAVVVVKR